jgi:hypothetical protein
VFGSRCLVPDLFLFFIFCLVPYALCPVPCALRFMPCAFFMIKAPYVF